MSIGSERARAVAFDSEGNALAAGDTEVPQGPEGTSLFTVAKWSAKGVRRWSRSLSDAQMTRSQALSVAAAPDGSVVAGGHLALAGGNQQFAVAKWSKDGEEQWVRRFDRSATFPDQARVVAVDRAGDVLAVGNSFAEDTGFDVSIYKLRGTDGEVLWSRHADGPERAYDTVYALVLNADGDLFVGGEIGNATESSCAVMKIRGTDGVRLWTNSLDRPNAFGGGEHVRSVALTSDGDVVACGTAYSGETGSDFMVGRFDGETGSREWQHFVDANLGPTGHDEGLAVAVDSRNDVLAVGNSPDISGNYALLVKLNGSSGLEQWRGRPPLSVVDPDFSSAAALALAVDDRDHAFVLCHRFGDADAFDALVSEWNTSGASVSLRQLPEAGDRSDELVEAIAVDHRGNLAVGGESARDFTVAYRASGRVERLVIQPSRLSFGRVEVGEHETRSFLIRNAGTAPLLGRIASSDPQFLLGGQDGPVDALDIRVPARKSLRVFTRFASSDSGRRTSSLAVTNSDPRRPTVRIPVTGIGKAAPAKD